MNSVTLAAKRHSLAAFFVLAYGLSWGSYMLSAAWPDVPLLFPLGPLLAALIVAGTTRGGDGLKDLLRRCVRWRVGLIWYVAALLVPVVLALAAVALNLVLGAATGGLARLGPWYSLFMLFPLALVDAPLGEEPGWRGYALPRLPVGRSPLANTLWLGVLIAGWHLPVALAAPSVAAYLIGAIASAILINWVYYNARESALLAVLFHTAQNTIGGFYLFQVFSGADLVRLWWLWATMYVVAAAAVVLVTGANLGVNPTRQAVAFPYEPQDSG